MREVRHPYARAPAATWSSRRPAQLRRSRSPIIAVPGTLRKLIRAAGIAVEECRGALGWGI